MKVTRLESGPMHIRVTPAGNMGYWNLFIYMGIEADGAKEMVQFRITKDQARRIQRVLQTEIGI